MKGAYGLRFSGLPEAADDLLIDAPDSWPRWLVQVSHDSDRLAALTQSHESHIDDEAALFASATDGFAWIQRANSTTTLLRRSQPSPDELVHPGIASTAAAVAWWRQMISLHGCGVTDGTGALAFLGDREHGKSSTLAWMLSHGWNAVSDDVLIVDGIEVLAGPRVVDLRREAAEHWDSGTYLGVIGARERWRFRTAPVAASSPLQAIVVLAWGPRLEVERIPAAQRLELIIRHRAFVPPHDQAGLLRLLGVPMLRLYRPRDIAAIGDGISMLLEHLGLGQPGRLKQ